ncbi:MAG: ATP-binding cassette domain-containing protein [Lachnospiraceae bacterium]|nr:ATP-binding cassette domain-containing protein [Lachnospiraceae bacterium]
MELEIKNLTKTYGDKKALDGFSIKMTEGIYGLLGPNGAGKSTLMGLLTGNVERETGKILLNGTDIIKMGKEYRKQVGYMPQKQICYPEMTLLEFMGYMAAIKEVPKKDKKKSIEGIISWLNLSDVRRKRLKTFSGGMLRRAILGQALLGNPSILILDEPTAGLDPGERISLRKLIQEISGNKIVLLATHIVSDIESTANQVILIKKGKLLSCDSPEILIGETAKKISKTIYSGYVSLEDVYLDFFKDK